jgi:hypothetical protein
MAPSIAGAFPAMSRAARRINRSPIPEQLLSCFTSAVNFVLHRGVSLEAFYVKIEKLPRLWRLAGCNIARANWTAVREQP